MAYQIANTFFEEELLSKTPLSLEQALLQNPIFSQLQFLPLLYGTKKDFALFTTAPNIRFLEMHPLTLCPFSLLTDDLDPAIPLESWAPSTRISEWASEKGLSYSIPETSLTQTIHSKKFAFENSTPLAKAQLIETETELHTWIHSFPGKKVLKTCFGTAGRGHFFLEPSVNLESLRAFTKAEWNNNRPVIGEPWVERVFDFSTQWLIRKEGPLQYLGATVCGNTKRGQYGYTTIGEEDLIFGAFTPFLKEHLQVAKPLVQKIQSLGWFGNLGIDAFVYKSPEMLLHPIVEINARKTMGYAALAIRNLHYPKETIQVSYQPFKSGLLPPLSRKNLRIEIIVKKDVSENEKTCLQLSSFQT